MLRVPRIARSSWQVEEGGGMKKRGEGKEGRGREKKGQKGWGEIDRRREGEKKKEGRN